MNRNHLSSGMGIWFEQHLKDLLIATRQTAAGITTLLNTEQAALYQRGFDDAINAVALAILSEPITTAYRSIDNG